MSKKKDDRYKRWLFLLYPDEVYPDWMRRLTNSGVAACVGPVHHNDIWGEFDPMVDNPRCGCSPDLREYFANLQEHNYIVQEYEIGKPKKPHRHIVLEFSGSKSQEQVEDFCVEIFQDTPPTPFRCHDTKGAVQYTIHYNNPEKEQFTIQSITSVNGFEVDKWFKPTEAQQDELFRSIKKVCVENKFNNFFLLMDFLSDRAKEGDYVEEFRYCRTHVHLINSFVRSMKNYQDSPSLRDDKDRELYSLEQIAHSLIMLSQKK